MTIQLAGTSQRGSNALTLTIFSPLQYAGDLQLELAFAYGSYGYGLCDQVPDMFTCVVGD